MRPNTVIIGSGPSGLAAGIELAQRGRRVRIVEQRSSIGGKCQSITMRGMRFEIGPNGFGSAIEGIMQGLGVQQKFMPVSHRLVFADKKTLSIPLSITSAWTLLYPLAIMRLLNNIKYAKNTDTLADITNNLHNKQFANMVHGLVAGTLFRPVEQVDLTLAQNSLKNDYGYENPRVPVGGTQSLIESMRARYLALGGEIICNSRCQHIESKQSGSAKQITIVNTTNNETSVLTADTILSSAHGWQAYPKDAKPSLSISAFLFALNDRFQYPENVHTTLFFPGNVQSWFQQLEQGNLPPTFGFHCFKNYPANAISAYFLSPRGVDNYSSATTQTAKDYIVSTISRKMPGFAEAIVESDFYSPGRYRQELGFESTASPCIPPKGFQLPTYDPQTDVYYIGNAVNGRHDQHLLGALRSAHNAVEEVIRREKTSCTATTTNRNAFFVERNTPSQDAVDSSSHNIKPK